MSDMGNWIVIDDRYPSVAFGWGLTEVEADEMIATWPQSDLTKISPCDPRHATIRTTR